MSDRTQADHGTDPRIRRHALSKAKILREAWKLAAREGVPAISLGELAKKVGLRQPSLYTYFSSKGDLFDAMYAQGNQQLLERLERIELPEDPVIALKAFFNEMSAFAMEDPARYQLLFQRNIPGFEPSPSSYALAVRFYDRATALMRAAGIEAAHHIDVFTALIAGVLEQQLANDPGGTRWVRHLDWVIEMFLREIKRQNKEKRR
jgi:AcrR family transcriptional regulator